MFKQTKLSKHSYKKYSAANDWIFKYLKGISPPIMNEIFSQSPKTVYCELETMAHKGPQLWQLPAKIKKVAP